MTCVRVSRKDRRHGCIFCKNHTVRRRKGRKVVRRPVRFVHRRERGQVRQDQHVPESAQGVVDQTHLVRLRRSNSFIVGPCAAALMPHAIMPTVYMSVDGRCFFCFISFFFCNANVSPVSVTAGARGGGRVEGRGELGEISRGRRAADGSLD